jgi:TPR repeat protein
MYCHHCGSKLEMGLDYCSYCGRYIKDYGYHQMFAESKFMRRSDFATIRRFAEQGNIEAQKLYGDCCHYLCDDDEAAFIWYQKAAEQGNPGARHQLADLCFYREDTVKAFGWYEKAAWQGYAASQDRLGDCYRYGIGTYRNDVKAAIWYERAAQQGNGYSQTSLGICYFYGCGVKKDLDKAEIWLLKAVKQGHTQAKYYLGWCYYYRQGVGNREKAFAYWLDAVGEGHVLAKRCLAGSYYFGCGTAVDKKMAFSWFTRPFFGYDDINGTYKYYAESLAACQQKAAAGNNAALFTLGEFYKYMEASHCGTEEELAGARKLAFNHYHQAAKLNCITAQYELGWCYYNGWGVEQNWSEALRWLEKSAKQGNVDAQGMIEEYHQVCGE